MGYRPRDILTPYTLLAHGITHGLADLVALDEIAGLVTILNRGVHDLTHGFGVIDGLLVE